MRQGKSPRSMRVRVAALAVILLSGAGNALSAQHPERWRSIRTDHFYLVGDAEESAMRDVARRLEEFRAGYLGVQSPAVQAISPEESTTVVVFRNDESFTPYKPLDADGTPRNVGGLFLGTEADSYIVLTAEDGHERSIYHEYSHRVSPDATGWPLWLQEGFADFYSTLQVRDGGRVVRTGLPIHSNLSSLRESPLIPLDVLMQIDRGSPYYTRGPEQALFYAQSWALTHYLMLKRPGGKAQLEEFIRLTGDGVSPRTSFEQAFDVDFQTMLGELGAYVADALTFPIIDYRLSRPIRIDDDWDSQPIPLAEVYDHLGKVLSRLDRTDAAREYLARAVAVDPGYDKPQGARRSGAVSKPELVGDLESLKCGPEGVELTILTDAGTVRFSTHTQDAPKIVSLDARFRDSIACSRFFPHPRVLVSYTPDTGSAGSGSIGVPERIVILPE